MAGAVNVADAVMQARRWVAPGRSWRNHAVGREPTRAVPGRTLCGLTYWTFGRDSFRQRCARCERVALALAGVRRNYSGGVS